MPVDRELMRGAISADYVPEWHCPTCKGGYLKLKPESLHNVETPQSRSSHDHQAWEPDWVRSRFTAMLVCNNNQCQQPVTVSGWGKVEIVQTSHDGDYKYEEFFFPEYMDPSPLLIKLPEECVEVVYGELQRAFVASWNDVSSSANHIRSATEFLLDHLKEPKTVLTKKGSRDRLSLHQRIINLSKKDKDLSDSLLAVKWLGNSGSHADELSDDDLYDALDILETILDDVFVKHQKVVKKKIAAINKRKGPVRKK